jgi:hypothetical protein
MIKKIIVYVSTDIENLENYSLDVIFREDIVDYEIEDLTQEEREMFDD